MDTGPCSIVHWFACLVEKKMALSRIVPALAVAAVAVCGVMGATIRHASADIVCDRDGDDCWHVDHRYDRTPPGVTFVYHPDDWYFHRDWDRDRDWHWRHARHDRRGYWRGGVWVTF
jgi:hypothetical protein